MSAFTRVFRRANGRDTKPGIWLPIYPSACNSRYNSKR